MRRWIVLLCLLLVTTAPVAAAGPPGLMLASTWEGRQDVKDYWVSEKLDGVRARWDGRALWTRGGHRIAAPAWFTAGWPSQAMDGELWIGHQRFDEASAVVRALQADEDDWRGMRFMAFDLPGHPGPFEQRLRTLEAAVAVTRSQWLQVIEQQRVPDAAALQARLQAVVQAGGEGLMLHHRDGLKRSGRSHHLFKLKPWEDAEARVVAHIPGKGKYHGMLGALLVEREDGVRFRLGSGFKDAQRADPPAVGARVTYRYNGLTGNGLPRFARFLRIRDEPPAPRR